MWMMENENLSKQVIYRVRQFQEDRIPEQVYHCAKRCVLDYCGVVLAGAKINKSKNIEYIEKYLSCSVEGTSSIFGMSRKTDIYTAALMNGMNAHVLELDDGHRFGMMHMGATVISSIFAVAEGRNLTGEKILRAIICGYDVAIALARCMQPGHKLKGYHATGTCCTIGGAMGIALMLDYDEEQMMGTLASAATSSAGLLEVIDDASELKPYNIGRASMDSIAAAFVGGARFKAPNDVIGGKRGFFATMAAKEDYELIKKSQLFDQDRYAITEIYTKPYAACRHCHPAIEAGLNIYKQAQKDGLRIVSDVVKCVNVYTYKLAIAGHDHSDIQGVSSAKMSTPYSVSSALLRGDAGMNAYAEEALYDTDIIQLMKKINVKLDLDLNNLCPKKRVAVVEVQFFDGCSYSSRVDYPRGEPENKMEDDELESKLEELAILGGKSQSEIAKIKSIIWNYNEKANELFGQLR